MQDVDIWTFLLQSFQSSPDWIKALWIVVPPLFVVEMTRILARRRAPLPNPMPETSEDAGIAGTPLYTIYRGENGQMYVAHRRYRFGEGRDLLPGQAFLEPYKADDED